MSACIPGAYYKRGGDLSEAKFKQEGQAELEGFFQVPFKRNLTRDIQALPQNKIGNFGKKKNFFYYKMGLGSRMTKIGSAEPSPGKCQFA